MSAEWLCFCLFIIPPYSIICLCTFIFKKSQILLLYLIGKLKWIICFLIQYFSYFHKQCHLRFIKLQFKAKCDFDLKSVIERLSTRALTKREGAIKVDQKDNKGTCSIATEYLLPRNSFLSSKFYCWQKKIVSNIFGILLDRY